jgi:pimeloyl-ACP methyl ester carboxylesterase
VLVPPSSATYRNWRRVAPGLARHHCVLALYYIGTVDSDKPLHGFHFSPQEQSNIIAAFMDVLEIERASLVGVSYGGTIVLNFAGRYPDRTRKVVAIEGFISPELGLPNWNRLRFWTVSAPVIGDLIFAVIRSGLLNRHFAEHTAGSWWDEMGDEERRKWFEYVASEVRYANRPGWGGMMRSFFKRTGESPTRCNSYPCLGAHVDWRSFSLSRASSTHVGIPMRRGALREDRGNRRRYPRS